MESGADEATPRPVSEMEHGVAAWPQRSISSCKPPTFITDQKSSPREQFQIFGAPLASLPPLNEERQVTLIIIDALDECKDSEKLPTIVELLPSLNKPDHHIRIFADQVSEILDRVVQAPQRAVVDMADDWRRR
ncbi:hypothetical protein VUR80DRAFT_4517 [Thermomyces stellatus]